MCRAGQQGGPGWARSPEGPSGPGGCEQPRGGAGSLWRQRLLRAGGAAVNNTLSDAEQEPAVSNMSVAMATLLLALSISRLPALLPPFISASSRAGCPTGPPVLPLAPRQGRGCPGNRAHAVPQCPTGTEAHTVLPSPAASLSRGWRTKGAKFSLWHRGLSGQGQVPSCPLQPLPACWTHRGCKEGEVQFTRAGDYKTDGLELGERMASQEPLGVGALPPPTASLILLHISVSSSLLSAFSSSV